MPGNRRCTDTVACTAQMERGRTVFGSQCAECHASGGPFCRGSAVMSWIDEGLDAGPPNPAGPGDCGALFFHDMRVKRPNEDVGNRTAGHLYGTGLPAAYKDALLASLKAL